jgi:hypothetical protein
VFFVSRVSVARGCNRLPHKLPRSALCTYTTCTSTPWIPRRPLRTTRSRSPRPATKTTFNGYEA